MDVTWRQRYFASTVALRCAHEELLSRNKAQSELAARARHAVSQFNNPAETESRTVTARTLKGNRGSREWSGSESRIQACCLRRWRHRSRILQLVALRIARSAERLVTRSITQFAKGNVELGENCIDYAARIMALSGRSLHQISQAGCASVELSLLYLAYERHRRHALLLGFSGLQHAWQQRDKVSKRRARIISLQGATRRWLVEAAARRCLAQKEYYGGVRWSVRRLLKTLQRWQLQHALEERIATIEATAAHVLGLRLCRRALQRWKTIQQQLLCARANMTFGALRWQQMWQRLALARCHTNARLLHRSLITDSLARQHATEAGHKIHRAEYHLRLAWGLWSAWQRRMCHAAASEQLAVMERQLKNLKVAVQRWQDWCDALLRELTEAALQWRVGRQRRRGWRQWEAWRAQCNQQAATAQVVGRFFAAWLRENSDSAFKYWRDMARKVNLLRNLAAYWLSRWISEEHDVIAFDHLRRYARQKSAMKKHVHSMWDRSALGKMREAWSGWCNAHQDVLLLLQSYDVGVNWWVSQEHDLIAFQTWRSFARKNHDLVLKMRSATVARHVRWLRKWQRLCESRKQADGT